MEKIICFACGNEFTPVDEDDKTCQTCHEEFKKAMADYDEFCVKEAEETENHNRQILEEIALYKSADFIEAIDDICKEDCACGKFELVGKPEGSYQKEDWHPEIQGLWVNQWCNGGYCGDDYEGDLYIKITHPTNDSKYLKIPYSM